MTVWYDKKKKGYRYDFWLFNLRHTYPRSFAKKQDAIDAEEALRTKLKRIAADLEAPDKPESPRFSEVAGAYYQFLITRDRLTDPETVDRRQRVLLRFFGPRPTDPTKVKKGSPYHDLRLADVIEHPTWILKFEQWLEKRGVKGSTKNRYRSAASRLYWFAMLPQNREDSGVTINPFRGILRDHEEGRDVVITPEQLRRIMQHASMHLRLALAIGALAPKLRMENILSLKWRQHFDAGLTTIRIREHKTKRKTKRMMVAPISSQLQQILLWARARQPAKVPWVIHYRKRRLKKLHHAMADACHAAGIPYGRAADGPTFHTLRHTAATMLAAMGVSEGLRKDVMGHLSIQTTQGYTHLQPIHEVAPLEQLAGKLPLQDIIEAPRLVGRGRVRAPKRRQRSRRSRASS